MSRQASVAADRVGRRATVFHSVQSEPSDRMETWRFEKGPGRVLSTRDSSTLS